MENKLTLTFTWENRKDFKMTAKQDGGEVKVVHCEENGHIAVLWPNIEAACKLYVQAELEKMGKDMKEP